MQAVTESPTSHRCPVCGGPNDCALAAAGQVDVPCWCTGVTFTAEVLALVPPELKRVACICRRCATGADR